MKRTGRTVFHSLTGPLSVFWIAAMILTRPILSFAKPDVRAEVDRREVSLGESLQLTVTLRSDGDSELEASPPDQESLSRGALRDFEIESFWPGSGQFFESINGVNSFYKTLTYNYTLTPKRRGDLNIGPISMQVEGKSLATDSIAIVCLDSGRTPRGGTGRRGRKPGLPGGFGGSEDGAVDPFDELDQLLRRRFGNNPGMIPGLQGPQPKMPTPHRGPPHMEGVLQIWVDAEKTDVFVHEPLFVNWYVYTKGELRSLDRVAFPSLTGFWKEIINEVPALQFFADAIAEEPVRRALLASHALFALSPGEKSIDEYRIKATVALPSAPGFQFGGANDTIKLEKTSPKLKVHVKPIPEVGRPSSFIGGVGNFTVNSELKDEELRRGEPFLWRLRFEGSGNAKFIEVPEFQLPDGLKVYSQKEESRFFKDGNSHKTYEVWFVSSREGEIVFPKQEFSVFDPKSESFKTLATPEVLLKFSPPTDMKPNDEKVVEKAPEAKPDLMQSLYPMPSKGSNTRVEMHAELIFGSLALAIVCLGALGFLQLRRRKKKNSLREEVSLRWQKVESSFVAKDYRESALLAVNTLTFVLSEASFREGSGKPLPVLILELPASLRKQIGDQLEPVADRLYEVAFSPSAVHSPEKLKLDLEISWKLILKALEI